MKHTDIRALYRSTEEFAGRDVTVAGWIRTNRNSNKFGFIELNDGTFFKSVQIVYEEYLAIPSLRRWW
jgi:asparaginyl-tRNA synthetase